MSFDDYIVTHKKHYTGAEYRLRKKIFETRVAEIKAHNEQEGKTFFRAINHFTDHTEHELAKMAGLNKVRHYGKSAPTFSKSPLAPRTRKAIDASIDWTTKGATTPVKNQLSCGSCWAFAGTESIESCGFLGSNKLVVLSPQEYVDCAPNDSHCGGAGGCEGATPDILFDFAVQAGAVREVDYPYKARDNQCLIDSLPTAVSVGGYTDVTNNDYNALLEAANGQPVTVGVAASEWFSYGGGVFSFDSCGPDVNHAVLLVGYGTDATLGDYWKVQNSWGAGWGEHGFIRLQRRSNDTTNCQLDTTPLDGFGCQGGPANVTICGTCGILYGASYATNCKVL